MGRRSCLPTGRLPAYDVPLSNFSYRVALDFSVDRGGLTHGEVAKLLCMNKQTVIWVEKLALRKDHVKAQVTEKFGNILDFRCESKFGSDGAPEFREGVPSAHDFGVAYFGPWEARVDGFNEHTRRSALALSSTGCPVHLRSVGRPITFGTPRALPGDIGHILTTSIGMYTARIYQLVLNAAVANNIGSHKDMTQEEILLSNRYKIVYSVWERDRISKEFAAGLSRLGQVWCACQENKLMLLRSGVPEEKVRVVPLPYFDTDPLLKLRGRERKKGVPRFYHIGKWEPRKAQDKILEAFFLAFKPGAAHLVMKCNALVQPISGYPQGPKETIVKLLGRSDVQAMGWTRAACNEYVEIISQRLTQDQILALHSFGDIYISMSRGEGWDMPAYDAKLSGNMLVFTPSGGPQDFATSTDVMIGRTGYVPCHSFYGWESDAQYIDFSMDDAINSLRAAAVAFKFDKPVSMDEGFEAKNVGKYMLGHIEELIDGPAFRR